MTTTMEALPVGRGVDQWSVWTTTARVVTTDPAVTESARHLVESQLAAVDRAASRFRSDSEVIALAHAGGRPVRVSPLLAELVAVALRAAEDTEGDVDPTLGAQLAALGYDADITRAGTRGVSASVSVVPRADWRDVRLDGCRLQIPAGTVLDLGATAKAWAADRCAAVIADRLGGGVLVSLGGDLSVAGEDPPGGWTILVQDGPAEPASTIALSGAKAVATSSILGRSWRLWNQRMHHILDPVTCRPAPEIWRTASVAAPSCVTANVLSTAALVRGRSAPDLLRAWGTPARLVAADGSVTTLNGWPAS